MQPDSTMLRGILGADDEPREGTLARGATQLIALFGHYVLDADSALSQSLSGNPPFPSASDRRVTPRVARALECKVEDLV